MKRTGLALVCFLLFTPFLSLYSSAQTPAIDSNALNSAILTYTRSNTAEAKLYNGILYAGYDHQPKGHPFFQSDSNLIGSITYDDIIYPEIRLHYDLEKDIVIIPNKRSTVEIRLLSEKLSDFTIGNHQFTHLLPDSVTVNAPPAGFYEVLYKGKTTALVHHRKRILNTGRAEENLSHYQQYDYWYLEQNGKYHSIHKNSDLINAFGSKNSTLKDFLKKNHLNFKEDPDNALAKTAEFYSRSTN